MTKERAINLCHAIDQYLCAGNPIWDTAEIHDAISMAIEALQEQKTGKWTKETKHYKDQFQEFNYYTIKCSVCGSSPEKNWHLTHYCPNCGSRMLEGGEEE